MDYAAHVTTLQQPDDKGFAARAHLLAKVRMGKATAEERQLLEGPPFPETVAYLWEWHQELARTRSVGMAGVDPLSYPAIDAWARLTDRHPLPDEVDALLQLDAVTRSPEAAKAYREAVS
jgi:hypothetical protein